MYTALVLHGVESIQWGKQHKLNDLSYTRELLFISQEGDVRVEIYSKEPISINEGTPSIRPIHNVD